MPDISVWKIIIVSSKSQTKTRSGAFELSKTPASDAILLVGLGFACLRPLARPTFVVGVVAVDFAVKLVFGEIESGEFGEWESAKCVGVVGWASDGLSSK